MVGLLSQDEIEALLRRCRVGRMGCCIDDRPYVVPVNFAYDGSAVYVVSGPGRKIDAMRTDPRVCFEVDEIDESDEVGGATVWRSVIADGVYEELTADGEQRAAFTLLGMNSSGSPSGGLSAPAATVVFRIDLTEKSGRFGRESSRADGQGDS
jgi:nitroimidazol reductase NimA-like FMN-containing flavoprotein (pyridoxamine 5'-phosphate oxidase superfamily)